MKKFCIVFLSLFIIILTAYTQGVPKEAQTQAEYLRIHIRANSNDTSDQGVKYLVRDAIVERITPWIVNCQSKEQAVHIIKSRLSELEKAANKILTAQGFYYGTHAEIRQEQFPTRVYEEYVLESGVYDALILELGTGEGDNWWCCIYPPLCFVNVGGANIRYRSKIIEMIEEFFT